MAIMVPSRVFLVLFFLSALLQCFCLANDGRVANKRMNIGIRWRTKASSVARSLKLGHVDLGQYLDG